MRRTTLAVGLVAAVLFAAGHESAAQRGRGGFGGVRAGGAAVGPYGGAGVGARSAYGAVGPYGGARTAGRGSGSYTTQRGTTINYAGAGRGGTTPGGINYGRGVGGVQVTTPGGRTASHVGTAGGVRGPGGNAIGGRAGATVGAGPGGSFGSAYRGGIAVGPHGAAAGGTRVGTATGIGGGTASGVAHRGAAVGPYGAVAGGTRYGAAAGAGGVAWGGARGAAAWRSPYGTYYASRAALATTGGVVRTGFGYYHAFTPAWYARYPGAWYAAGWTAARIWAAPVWGSVATYCGYPAQPVYYDYGDTVVYTGDTVILNGDTEVPAEQYARQATDLATTGKDAKVEPKADDWQPLGVFAMVQEGEEKATNIFQLAVNKDGVIRGNYYNAVTDETTPVYGSVDKKTQRAAWTVGDRKTPVYEAGIANLTKDETTMLAHYAADKTQQFTLVRVRQQEGEPPPDGK
jgi:hypothetical protein